MTRETNGIDEIQEFEENQNVAFQRLVTQSVAVRLNGGKCAFV